MSTTILIAIFLANAAVVWLAGIFLSRTTDSLDIRLNLGEELGGMILLAIAGTLPEVAITVSAALAGHLDLAAGNLIGGIAIQTVVLVLADAMVAGDKPLSYLVGSLTPVIEAGLVVLLVALAMMGALLPATSMVKGVSPASLAIVIVWVIGIVVLNRARKEPRWEAIAPGSKPGRPHRRIKHPAITHPYASSSTLQVTLIFLGASVFTLIGGFALQYTGSILASRFHMTGIVFGATVLALASALPEISTSVTSIRLGDNKLVMGDIFGGNAFQLCLFLVADVVAGRPALPLAGVQNSWLAAVSILLTAVYAVSIIARPNRRIFRLGMDSIAVIILYAIALLGLVIIK